MRRWARMVKPLLIAMVGLPRSGKSTISRRLADRLHAPIVKKDDIRLALHGQRYQLLAEDFIRAIGKVMIRSLFLSGSKIVIADETHYSRAARDHVRDSGWDTEFYHVDTSPEVCIERAYATNQADLEPVIKEMWLRWEPLKEDEPRYSLGL
jgi:predicted kinase